MEVIVVSREAIKPCSLPNHNIPLKISLLDQLTPATQGPCVFFYGPTSTRHVGSDHQAISTLLKTSLSKTLTPFYPFSGRVSDNLHVSDFDSGVPFLEARATCTMSHYLSGPDLSTLDKLLPCLPFRDETSTPHAPLLAVQLTAFECGGVALGLCVSHKLTDGFTRASFLNNWTSTARGHDHGHDHLPDFSEAPTRFPSIDPLPKSMASVYEDVWFGQSTNFKTERFVFGAEALAAVKKRAASEAVPKPTRVQALSGFIWKSVMEASRKASDSSSTDTVRSRVIAHAVNIRRPREKLPGTTSTVTSIGNLFWWAIAFYYDECAAKDGDVLSSLVELVNESISEVNSGYMKSLQGEEAMELVTGHLKQIEEIYSLEDPEIFGFTSWVNLGLKDTDFGWGKPVWVGVFGEVGASFRNLTVLNDAASGGGIEAWVTLEDKVLDNLKNDVQFLALAALNPPILMP